MQKFSGCVIALITLSVIVFGFIVHGGGLFSQKFTEENLCETKITEKISLTAKTASVINIKTGEVLYEKKAQAQLPLASLTKIMTVLLASELLNDSSIVTIKNEALAPEGDSGFIEDELWKVSDLIDFTLITSSNDGARALALAIKESDSKKRNRTNFDFIKAMNAKAAQLGLTQTFFLNDTGLDVSTMTAGAYGSAQDISNLLSYVYTKASSAFEFSATSQKTFRSASGITHPAQHTSSVAGLLPGEVIAKTGFTDLAGGNLAVVAEPIPGIPVAIVVLGSTRDERDTDVIKLYDLTRKTLKRATLCSI